MYSASTVLLSLILTFSLRSFFFRFADTVLLAVKELAVQTTEENATQVYKAAGLDLLKNINAPPKQVRNMCR